MVASLYTPLFASPTPELIAVNAALAKLGRGEVIDRFQSSFRLHRRQAAFVFAEELTRRGIPPCFRHRQGVGVEYTANQQFDMMVADLRWLAHAHRDHAKQIRYKRSRELFTAHLPAFHHECEYTFYEGRRYAWQIVNSLSMSEQQQFDCQWLRSGPVAKRARGTQARLGRAFQAIGDTVLRVRKTRTFTHDDARATVRRRRDIWLCSTMTMGERSPAATAARYAQLTGDAITAAVAGRQLDLIDLSLRRKPSYDEGPV